MLDAILVCLVFFFSFLYSYNFLRTTESIANCLFIYAVCFHLQMNSTILDVFKSRNINGEFSGTVIHFYSFSYEGKDDTWYKGEIFPVTSLKTPLEKGKGIRVSIWTFPAEKEKELKEMILDLLPLESTALLKPSFAAYNSHIDRAILCCTPCTSNLTSWIAKQVQIPSDSYLQEDSKNMIRYA